METWVASDLVNKFMDDLCSIVVLTPEMGDYSGGLAEIIEIKPDINVPEIVFNVLRYCNNEEILMGIFHWEEIEVHSTHQATIFSF